MKNLLLILVVLLNVPPTAAGGKQPAKYVSFCEIVRHPEKYDQQMVLTAGVIEHGTLFFDPAPPAVQPAAPLPQVASTVFLSAKLTLTPLALPGRVDLTKRGASTQIIQPILHFLILSVEDSSSRLSRDA
jgi:hypothetical protein